MKKIILSDKLAKPAGPFSQAVESNGLLFTSGQLPFDKNGSLILDDVISSTKSCLDALEHLAKEVNSTRDDIVKVTIYLDSIEDYTAMNEVYSKFFEGCHMPARTAFEVANLPFGVKVEIEAVIKSNL